MHHLVWPSTFTSGNYSFPWPSPWCCNLWSCKLSCFGLCVSRLCHPSCAILEALTDLDVCASFALKLSYTHIRAHIRTFILLCTCICTSIPRPCAVVRWMQLLTSWIPQWKQPTIFTLGPSTPFTRCGYPVKRPWCSQVRPAVVLVAAVGVHVFLVIGRRGVTMVQVGVACCVVII